MIWVHSQETGRLSGRHREQARSHKASEHLSALLTATLFVVCADWHGLQRRFNQAESNTEVVEPVLNFLFHGAPFRVVPSDRDSVAASH